MGRLQRTMAITTAACAMLAGAATTASAQDTLYGLTGDQALLRFSSSAPGAAAKRAITGLPLGVRLEAIDTHPRTGDLYGVSDDGFSLYTIDPDTGQAQPAGSTGIGWSDARRLGFDLGTFEAGTEPYVQTIGGDWWTVSAFDGLSSFGTKIWWATPPVDGSAPALTGLASDVAVRGGRHLVIDHAHNLLARLQDETRQVHPVGRLGVDVPDALGFANTATGALYLAFRPARVLGADSALYRVDRWSGAATRVGSIRVLTVRGTTASDVIGLAVAR